VPAPVAPAAWASSAVTRAVSSVTVASFSALTLSRSRTTVLEG
jgi:hypothetical protein